MAISYAVVAGLFGLIFGSAINAIVWRIKVGKSWTKGRSECFECGHVLKAADLVPVVSWLMLGGKCRYCRKPIKDHPVVELLTGLLFALSAYVLAPGSTDYGVGSDLTLGLLPTLEVVRLGFWLVMLTLLIILAVYDARWLILPDKIMVPLISVALVYSATMAYMTGSRQVLLGALFAAVLAGGAFFVIVAVSKGRAMGGGDIKLAFAMGLMLGLKGVAVALLVAFNAAAILGVALIAMKLRKRHDQIPFGPFLVGGAIVGFLWAADLVQWYLRLNGLA